MKIVEKLHGGIIAFGGGVLGSAWPSRVHLGFLVRVSLFSSDAIGRILLLVAHYFGRLSWVYGVWAGSVGCLTFAGGASCEYISQWSVDGYLSVSVCRDRYWWDVISSRTGSASGVPSDGNSRSGVL